MSHNPDLSSQLSPSSRALFLFVRNRQGTFAQLAADFEELCLLQHRLALSLKDDDAAQNWETAAELLDAALGPLHDAECSG